MESAQRDSFYWALYCSDSTMEAVRATEERYRRCLLRQHQHEERQQSAAVFHGNASLQGSASQDHPSDGSGGPGSLRASTNKIKCSGIFSSGWASAWHRCQGCPQNGAHCRRGRQSIWCTSSASSRPSARSRRRRSPEPLLAKCKASGIFSSSFYSVSLLYWSHTRKHTAEVLPFSAGKS